MREIVKVGTITTEDEDFKKYITTDNTDYIFNVMVINRDHPEYIINVFKFVDNNHITTNEELYNLVNNYINKYVTQPCKEEVKENDESEDKDDSNRLGGVTHVGPDSMVNGEGSSVDIANIILPDSEVNQEYKPYIPKPYCKCSKCGKVFNNNQDLKDDCIFVTESDTYEVYKCDVCGAQIRIGK
jgi:hypothetical protein